MHPDDAKPDTGKFVSARWPKPLPLAEYPEPNYTVYVLNPDNHGYSHSEGCHNSSTARAVADRFRAEGREVRIYQKGVGFVESHPVWASK